MSDAPTLLAVNNLSVRYGASNSARDGGVDAVRNVSFTISAGEMVGLVGESGSGKSTIAQSILGLLDQSSTTTQGNIQFNGDDVFTYDSRRWRTVRGRQIGMIFQSPMSSFNPVMTIGQQMVEVLRCHRALSKAEAKKLALTALNDVGMPRAEAVMEHYAFELSGGMCQRAALAMVMALKPALILADEPTASLDVVAQAELVRWLSLIQKKQGFAMLIISHDLNLMARLADRLVVMYQGKILEQGAAKSLLENPQHAYTAKLINAIPRLTEPVTVGNAVDG